jgi:hypothetical protein
MSKQTFVKGHLAAVTSPITEVRWDRVDVLYQTAQDPVTAIAATTHTFLAGLPVQEMVMHGSVYDVGGTAYATSNAITMAIGATDVHPYDWVVRRNWDLINVTGSGDTKSGFLEGIEKTSIAANAWVLSGGPDITGQALTVSTTMSIFGSITGTFQVNSFPISASTRQGPIASRLDMVSTGGTTFTTAAADLSSTFNSTTPQRGTTAIAITGGENITGTAIVYDVRIQGTRRRGGRVGIVARHRFDEP